MEMMHGMIMMDPWKRWMISLVQNKRNSFPSSRNPALTNLAVARVLRNRSPRLRKRLSSWSLMMATVAGDPAMVKMIAEKKGSKGILILKPVRLLPKKRKKTITEMLLARNLLKTFTVPS